MRSVSTALLCALTLSACVESSIIFGGPTCIEFGCLWETEQGTIEQTHSWHEHAEAYRLAGTPASISRNVDVSAFPDCVQVELNAKVARDAQFELQFDFGNDGIIDDRIAVEPVEWERRFYYLRTPANARHLRTRLIKSGPGDVSIDLVALQSGRDKCTTLPPMTLANDSACLDDASCTSGYCVLGKCSPCGAGGCPEGVGCRADKDCASSACAAGVCRACALTGSCGKGEGCSSDGQCSAKACTFGGQPSLVSYPELDGVCGECASDAQCASGHCVLGQCGDCATDADCGDGLRCRYADVLETGKRSCLPRFDGILPRGALCEVDRECVTGLLCGGAQGRPKRCGFSCRVSMDCGANEACGNTGSIPSTTQAGIYELVPAFAAAAGRINTCYPILPYGAYPAPACSIHAQCPVSPYSKLPRTLNSCCNGSCGSDGIDLATGACNYDSSDYLFTQFEAGR